MRCLLLLLLACATSALGFVSPTAPLCPTASAACAAVTTMGPAKDGPFTPAVLAAKVILGEPQLLKLRGKAIAYHSQYISEFCAEFGVPKKINQGLIKKAKAVGSDLGFLS